jgi:type IV fimbrial biogenesis protein FimT
MVELLVTLFLAAILFGLAIPSFRGMMANNRLVTQTNDLIGALTYARSEAITRNLSMTVCRAADDTTTACAGSAGDWGFWIIRNGAGAVVRRGAIPTYGGGLRVTSTLTNDSITYSSDGLARTGTPAAMLTTANTLGICVSTASTENIRTVTPGSGSRLSTAKSTGTC